ncbi:hypothetical protein G3I55_46375, partial [Streptomyces sp. SID6648]|nr:hypothetical protein [Streptomyces sp. SID6648]
YEPDPYEPDPYEAYEPQEPVAAASGPWAARNDGRPVMVQARVDGADWLRKDPEPDEAVQSPIGDQPEPVAEPEPEPVPDVLDEGADEGQDEVDGAPEPEPDLTGVELLEYRYLRLPAEERFPNRSASALAKALHPGTGFTEGTARKYLKPIIDKHS